MNILKTTILLIVLLFCGAASQAQVSAADTLVAYNHNGKWGFISRKAADVMFVIPATYELAYPFYDGRAAVRQNNLWGFIDAAGKLVIPYQYTFIKDYRFKKGLAAVKKGDGYGVIDITGKTVLPFSFIETWVYPKQQVIVASSKDPKNPTEMFGLQGMYSWSGKQLLKPEYENIDPFDNNKAICVTKNKKRSLVDTKGTALTTRWYESLTFSDIPHYVASNKNQFDLYSPDGKLIFSSAYDYVGALINDRAMYKAANGKWGYLDAKGAPAIEAKYNEVANFSEGKAIVKNRGSVDVLDASGTVLGSVQNGDLNYGFKNGIAWIRQAPPSFTYYAYGTDLQKAFPQGYDEVSSFDESGIAIVKQGKKSGLINKKGNVVLPFNYSSIMRGFKGEYIISTEDDARGVATADGGILMSPQKVTIYIYDDDFYQIRPQGYYFMDDNGDYFCMYRRDGTFYYDQKK